MNSRLTERIIVEYRYFLVIETWIGYFLTLFHDTERHGKPACFNRSKGVT